MDTASLTRQHEPRRPTRLALIASFSLVTGGAVAGATWATWLADSGPEPIVVPVPAPPPAAAVQPEVVVVEPKCPAPAPAPVVIVPAAPDPRFGQGSCPGRDAPRDPVIGQAWSDQDDLDETNRFLDSQPLIGVAASARKHGHLAVWTRGDVFYSDSDGRRFREVLRGPGRIYDALVDCRGAVFALRGAEQGFMLGYAHRHEQWWRTVNMRDPQLTRNDEGEITKQSFAEVSLAAGGGWIAIIAPTEFFGLEHRGTHTAIALSRDGGASWSFLNVPQEGLIEYADVASIDDDGRLRMLGLEGDCMYDGTSVHTIQLSTGKAVSSTQLSTNYQLSPTLSSRWAYDTRECAGPLCALDMRRDARSSYPDLPWVAVTGLRASPESSPVEQDSERYASIYANGRVYAHYGSRIFRVRGRTASPLGAELPDDVSFAAMDSSFRLLGITADDRLIRWSPRRGVRVLRGQTLD